MLKNFIRSILYNATSQLKLKHFNNFHPQLHKMPKFYFFQQKKSLLFRFVKYQNEIQKLEEATERQETLEEKFDRQINLIRYLENLLSSEHNLPQNFKVKYANSLIQWTHDLEHFFGLYNVSSQNKYILSTEKLFNESLMTPQRSSEIIELRIFQSKHNVRNQIWPIWRIKSSKILIKFLRDLYDFYDFLEQKATPQQLTSENVRKIYLIFIISSIFRERGDKKEEERFFYEALLELQKQSQVAINLNLQPLKLLLNNIILSACVNFMLYKDKKDRDSYQKFILHITDNANIFDDDQTWLCITQLLIDYLLIQQEEVDIEVFCRLSKMTRENDFCNRNIAAALLSRALVLNKQDKQAKLQLLTQIENQSDVPQYEANYFSLYHLTKYHETLLIQELETQDISNLDERINYILCFLKHVNCQCLGNAPDYDFFRVVLNLERYNLPQEKECLVLQKLLHAFQQIQPKEFTGSKQELENQYSLTLIVLKLQEYEKLPQQSGIVEYNKFITQFIEIDSLANIFYRRLLKLNQSLIKQFELSIKFKEHAEELQNSITQAILKANQLNGLEHKHPIIKLLSLQLEKVQELINKKE